MTSENSENTNIVLPEEILTEIISRLPVKPVFQLQCLSKNFSSITNDVSFINAHLGHSARLCPSIIFNKGHDIFLIRNNRFESETTVEEVPLHRIIDLANSNKKLKIEASCNGLVIFSVDDNDCFIWNPATMQCDNLPNPSIVVDKSVWISGWGFGYCTESNQYKIVRIASYSDGFSWGDDETIVEVISYGTDCEWRRLDFSKFDQFCNGPGITIKGVVYWTVLDDNRLFTFDLEKEEFAWIICPFSGCEKVMEFQGSLAACVPEGWRNYFDIWVLNDSWEIICSTRDIYPYLPIRFLNDHQLFLVHDEKKGFFGRHAEDSAEFSCSLYDMESEEIKSIPQVLVSNNSDILSFVESMVPLLSLVDLLAGSKQSILNVTC